MNQMTEPVTAAAGDRIEHDLMPGFVMTVQAVQPCDRDSNRDVEHAKFLVIDPDCRPDWLCGFDVHRVA